MQKYLSKFYFIKLFFFFIGLLLVTATISAAIQNGKYTSKQNLFQVDVPYVMGEANQPITWTSEKRRVYFQMKDGSPEVGYDFVDFMLHFPYWMEDGYYSIEWRSCGQVCFHSKAEFYKAIGSQSPSYVAHKNVFQNNNFKLYSHKRLEVNGYTAVQYIVIGKASQPSPVPSVLLNTVINFGNTITSVIYFAKIDSYNNVQAQIDWKLYNQFLYSLKPISS